MSEVNDLWLLIPGVVGIVWAIVLLGFSEKISARNSEKLELTGHRFFHTGLVLLFLGLAL